MLQTLAPSSVLPYPSRAYGNGAIREEGTPCRQKKCLISPHGSLLDFELVSFVFLFGVVVMHFF